MYKNKFTSHKKYLIAHLFSRTVEKTDAGQRLRQFFTLFETRGLTKPSKVAAAKIFLSSVCVIDIICFNE